MFHGTLFSYKTLPRKVGGDELDNLRDVEDLLLEELSGINQKLRKARRTAQDDPNRFLAVEQTPEVQAWKRRHEMKVKEPVFFFV